MRAVDIKNFFFLSFTPCTPPPARAYARPRVKGVKEGKKSRGHGSSRADRSSYAAGNSHHCHLTYFERSDRSGFGARRPACGPTLAHVGAWRSEAGWGPNTAHSATVAGVARPNEGDALAAPRQRERGLPGTAQRGRPRLGVVRRGWAGMGSAGRGKARRGMDAPRREGVAGAIGGAQSGDASANGARSGMAWLGQAGRGKARQAPLWPGEARRG